MRKDTVPELEWSDWHWQLQNALRTPQDALRFLGIPVDSFHADEAARQYATFATPFYLSLARTASLNDPILKQALPHTEEIEGDNGEDDPLSEEKDSPLPRLVHRYPDRALFLTCGTCAIHCRHCMRKRLWNQPPLKAPTTQELQQVAEYLRAHPEIREVLISGGDPLTMPDKIIADILRSFDSVPSLEMLRIGTRTVVALPQRFTPELCDILESSKKTIWIATHFNHPSEISAEAELAVRRLMKACVPVVNQAVLLKGINDDAAILGKLFTELLRIRIKPYYLFHGDPIKGTTCFRTGVQPGLELMRQLRNNVSGMAVPAFAFDLPHGGGKIRLEPDFGTGMPNQYKTRTGGTEEYMP